MGKNMSESVSIIYFTSYDKIQIYIDYVHSNKHHQINHTFEQMFVFLADKIKYTVKLLYLSIYRKSNIYLPDIINYSLYSQKHLLTNGVKVCLTMETFKLTVSSVTVMTFE